jgi:hypothetical protein
MCFVNFSASALSSNTTIYDATGPLLNKPLVYSSLQVLVRGRFHRFLYQDLILNKN